MRNAEKLRRVSGKLQVRRAGERRAVVRSIDSSGEWSQKEVSPGWKTLEVLVYVLSYIDRTNT